MESTLTIREAVPAELSAVAELWTAFRREHAPFHPSYGIGPEARPSWLAALRTGIATGSMILRVAAEPSGELVGYCRGRIEGLPSHESERRIGVIEEVYVVPESRDAGVGETLLAALVDELRACGVARLVTTACADNDGAIRFLERARFTLHTVTLSRDL